MLCSLRILSTLDTGLEEGAKIIIWKYAPQIDPDLAVKALCCVAGLVPSLQQCIMDIKAERHISGLDCPFSS